MPSVAARSFIIKSYTDPHDLPSTVVDALRSNERNSNCVLPKTLELLDVAQRKNEVPPANVWIACTTFKDEADVVELVLSCTGRYPVFIVTTLPTAALTDDFLLPRLEALAFELVKVVPIERVFSIFSLEQITTRFVGIWTDITGVQSYADEPYYAARISFCTRTTLSKRQTTLDPRMSFDLRPATKGDIADIADLCYGFAEESDPFILTREQALDEATQLVSKRQVWVHHVTENAGSQHSGLACIVAFTRNSDTNATITKVYTSKEWRRLGCAERLVRLVCKHLLTTKQTVSLYVAHNNPAAIGVYHRCGFVGLEKSSPVVDGVDNWLEIGFDQDKVTLGHW